MYCELSKIKEINRHTDTCIDTQTGRQTNIQTDRQTDRHADKTGRICRRKFLTGQEGQRNKKLVNKGTRIIIVVDS